VRKEKEEKKNSVPKHIIDLKETRKHF